MQLALYKGKGLIGNALVRRWTRSPYSHCELVIGDYCYSSSLMDKGVRRKQIILKPENWMLVPLPSDREAGALAYFEKTKDEGYSWLDLARSQVFNSGADEAGAAFCSEWCAAALGLPNPTSYSPKTLAELVIWLNANHWLQS